MNLHFTSSPVLGVLLSLMVVGCSDPEADFREAIETRNTEALEAFLKDHPESELVAKARATIKDIHLWDSVKISVDTSAYRLYEHAYPDGLFAKECTARVQELIAYVKVREADDLEGYEKYLSQYPDGVLKDTIAVRMEKVRSIALAYAALGTRPAIEDLRSFLEQQTGSSGYARKARSRLDSIAGIQLDKEVLARAKDLPSSFRALETAVTTTTTANKKYTTAYETYLLRRITLAGVHLLPSIPGSEVNVHQGNRTKFSIKDAHDREHPQRIIAFTEQAGDMHHVEMTMDMPGFPGHGRREVLAVGPGSVTMPDIQAVHNCTHGSLLRFHGTLPDIEGMRIENIGTCPLVFYLDKEYGWVHLYGKGKVVLKDGRLISFGL